MLFTEINAEKFGFDAASVDHIIAHMKKNEGGLRALSEKAYAGELPDFPICRKGPMNRLACLLLMLDGMHKAYREKGIPEGVFWDTFSDIGLRAELYARKTGNIGISKDDAVWFRHHFGMKLFKLGSLQFQLFNMVYLDEDGYMDFEAGVKTRLPPGTPVINVHIQARADLSAEDCDSAFSKAEVFFGSYFPEHDYKAFLCYCWMLYPGLREILPENSRIISFANRFEVIGSCGDQEMACERIFGGRRRKKSDYPQETSLQINALANMRALGYACGVIYR